jgi:hypothetical protein
VADLWKPLWRVLKVVLFAAILYGIGRALLPDLRAMDWSAVGRWRPEASRLVVSLIVLVAVYLAHAFLWRRIVIDLGLGRPSARTVLQVFFVSSLGRYLPGKFWQLAGLAALAARAGISPGGAAAASLLGQFAFLSSGLLFLAIQLPDFGGGAPARIGGIALVLAAGLLWLLTETPAGRQGREWVRARLGPRLGERLGTAFELAERVRGRDAILWGVGYGLTWIALGFAFSLFATAFVPEATTESRRLAGTVAAAYLAGYIVLVAPAGLGVREGAMTGLLAAIPTIPFPAAVVISVLSRVWFTVAEIVPLAIVPFMPRDPGPASSPKATAPDTASRNPEGRA